MIFDSCKLLDHFDQDKDLINELIGVLAETYPLVLSDLKAAFGQTEYSKIELHAHTMKGMLANFFAEDLKSAASRLEQLGRDQKLEDSAKEDLRILEEKIPVLIEELRGFCE